MTSPTDILGREKALVGMVHVEALPGTPRSRRTVTAIAKQAADEARMLAAAGFDSILIENMHDVPYLRRTVGPEIVSGMTAAGLAVRDAVDVPVGVQILAGANCEALAAAQAMDARYIRAEGFVFAAVADEGLLEQADAGPLLRYRRAIGAESIAILVDVKKKHSAHAITGDLDIAEAARATEFFGAEGVIVTGVATGQPTSLEELHTVKHAVDVPVLVGSGVTPETAGALLDACDALIVGSWIKHDGDWTKPVDPARAAALVESAR